MSLALPLAVAVPIIFCAILFVFGNRRLPQLLLMLLASLCAGVSAWLAYDVIATGPQRHPIGNWAAPLGIELHADFVSALMVSLTGVICWAVSLYSLSYFGSRSQDENWDENRAFWPLFYFLWAALNCIFLVADLFSLYVGLELLTLSAVALIVLKGEAAAKSVALRYLLTALVASLAYLLGVALIYGQANVLDYRLVAKALEPGWASYAALSFVTVGLATKTALFPVHFWLPGAHSRAPSPVSALLSGLVVKASFYVLFRIWLEVFPAEMLMDASHLLGVLGAFAVIWGSFRALNEERVKLIIAYSTVAQIGYLFIVITLLANNLSSEGRAHTDAWSGGLYFVAAHGVAKAALFLIAGIFQRSYGSDNIHELKGAASRLPGCIFVWGLAGISLIGLPPSGGFIAKWRLLLAGIQTNQWFYVVVILFGGLLASAYVSRVLWFAFQTPEESDPIPKAVVPRGQSAAILFLGLFILLMGLYATDPLVFLESEHTLIYQGIGRP